MTFEGTLNTGRSYVSRVGDYAQLLVEEFDKWDRVSQVSFVAILGIIVIAVAAPIIAPYDPAQPHYSDSLHPPSAEYLLGTDLSGRDVFSRLIHGTRVSLSVGVFAVSLAILIGVPAGSIGGYYGGWLDEVLMRSMDIILAFPALILALALVGAVGPSLLNLVIVIGVIYSPTYARLIHGEILSLKEKEYVEAAEGIGLGDTAILVKHIVPNAMTPLIVQASFHVAIAIILEASLSFLGLGVRPPTPTWGVMIADGRGYLPESWWLTFFPGVAIFILVLAFNLLGDGLRDVYDPRSASEVQESDRA